MGTWSFRARLGGNHARAGLGLVLGTGSGLWFLVRVPYPAWFFLNQVSRVWLREAYPLRYTDPNRPANGPAPLSGFEPLQLDSQQLRLLGQTIATVQTEPLQPFVGFGPVGPSWNSAPNSQLKHTTTKIRITLKIRSERGLRKFNRFFNRIVV